MLARVKLITSKVFTSLVTCSLGLSSSPLSTNFTHHWLKATLLTLFSSFLSASARQVHTCFFTYCCLFHHALSADLGVCPVPGPALRAHAGLDPGDGDRVLQLPRRGEPSPGRAPLRGCHGRDIHFRHSQRVRGSHPPQV
jgi:hypothetical protein